MKSRFPEGIGLVGLLYSWKRKPWSTPPIADQKLRIRLSPLGRPEFRAFETRPWMLYSDIHRHTPFPSRHYHCLGEEENGRAFVARISYSLWRAFETGGERRFLSSLKPPTIAQVEKRVRGKATLTANLWTLPLPTNWVHVRAWADGIGWDVVPRIRRSFSLLGQYSGWCIQLGGYTRPWHRGEPIAIAGGRVACPVLQYRLHLSGPHLVGLIPGWTYRW